MSCSIVINQQVPSPDPDRVASEVKIKDPKHVETACKGGETNGQASKINRRCTLLYKNFWAIFQV